MCGSHMTDHVILLEQSSLELKPPELLPRGETKLENVNDNAYDFKGALSALIPSK